MIKYEKNKLNMKQHFGVKKNTRINTKYRTTIFKYETQLNMKHCLKVKLN